MTIGIEDILTPERALLNVAVTSKKKLLEFLAGFVTEQLPGSTADDIFDRLLSRERLGSTGIGEGVAIPHCRLAGIDQAMGALFTLKDPIDFDAIDQRPVDLLFFLLVPEEACDEHLGTLAKLAESFSQESCRAQLRSAQSDKDLLRIAQTVFGT